jgi:hypothetical protein
MRQITPIVLAVLLAAHASAQFMLGPSFQLNKTITVVQEGVSFDTLTYQDSTKGKVATISNTANGYYSQYTIVDPQTLQATLYYAYEAYGEVVCYRFAAGTVPLPFPSSRPVQMTYLKQSLYNGKPMSVFQQNVGRYTRRLFTDVGSIPAGEAFRAILPNMEAMSMQMEATIINNTLSPASVFGLPPQCSDTSRVRVLRSPSSALHASVASVANSGLLTTGSARSPVSAHVKFNVRDLSNVGEEFAMHIKEVDTAMRRHGHALTPYSPLPSLVSPAGGQWTGPSAVNNIAYATAVRDQGMCGACWAFSSAATTEVVYNKLHNITAPIGSSSNWLSPQNLIDCAVGDLNGTALFPSKGCFGGWPLVAMMHIVLNGIVSEASYPFDSANGRQCLQASAGAAMYPLTAAHYIDYQNGPAANLNLLMAAVVAEGAVTAILNADPTLFYPGGIFDNTACTPSMGHAVTLIGFGTDEASTTDYWVVKNSFGAAWGEGGFFRIVRGVNMCGIEQMGFVAVAQ